MSASLVGSEMCIRDRMQTTARNRRSLSDRLSRHGNSQSLKWWAPLKSPAVSYTHLTLPTICSV
eukprot:15215716-Alexandrium_andersonii.AAC.1